MDITRVAYTSEPGYACRIRPYQQHVIESMARPHDGQSTTVKGRRRMPAAQWLTTAFGQKPKTTLYYWLKPIHYRRHSMDTLRQHYKCALVTGSSAGLGLAISQMLLDQGVDVVGMSRRPECPTLGGQYHPWPCDLSENSELPEQLDAV